ncbi:VOC family protein [Bacteriovoracaceae bacterium]|nr:VOC family protein [Bacteriovoracaceae bacterium]
MKITGINHITINCNDIEKAFSFYKNILGLKPIVKWERGAYLLAGDDWYCLSLNKNSVAMKDKQHIAFTVSEDDFDEMKKRLFDNGVFEWTENTSEGKSFYFTDIDNNQLEIHVGTWESRIESLKRKPFDGEIEFFV